MNKIYKVVWNAARNSYMVGSEFIRGSHSAGSRRISGRKLKGLVAAALLAGAILSPAGLMPASAFGGHGGYEKNYVTKGQLNEESSARKDADKNLQGQINGLEQGNNKQWGAIGKLENENDAQWDAIGDEHAWNKVQQGQINGLEQENDKQWGAINGNYVWDSIQQGQINGLEQENDKQWGAINGNYVWDSIQQGQINGLEQENKDQWVAIDKAHESVSAGNGLNVTEGTNPNGGTNYEVSLDNDFTVGDEDSHVTVTGTEGNIEATGTITAGSVTLNKDESGTVSGLTNKTWDKNANYEDSSLAATESQLQQAIQQTTEELINNSVQYDKTPEGTVDKTSVTLGDGKTAVDLGNVAAGEIAQGSTDAVNGGQLWAVQQDVNANTAAIGSLNSRVNTLDSRIDKVGANAAALAALHPLDFDPDDKWDFAAGYGNYGNENAMAVGAFYRPNEDTMFSVGGSFGTGENMVNAGVSFKIGQGNHVSTSRVAMAKEIETLRHNVAQLTALVNQLVGSEDQINNALAEPFPDVPENHWAYETVEQMRERGIVEGYPDGTFGGDRQMTRYEFATIVYRALQKGIGMNEDIQRLVDEFKPELALIRVDTIAQDSEGNPIIERVRVNKA